MESDKEYPLKIEAFGINENISAMRVFMRRIVLTKQITEKSPLTGTLLKEGYFEIKAACLTHQIPCLCFSLKEDFHINIDKAALNRLVLPVGAMAFGI